METLSTLPQSWVDFGREICGDLAAAEAREWLVTNGIGGFASGTVAGLLTRRYHGLLVAALKPPLGRTLLVAKLEETAESDGQVFPLSTNRWSGGAIDPRGYLSLERFHLEGTTPVWTFALADALLEKRVWMRYGSNTTYVRYDLVRARGPLKLTLRALVNYRDYHSLTQVGADEYAWRMDVQPIGPAGHGLRVAPSDGATPFYLVSAEAAVEPAHDWYRNFDLALERSRGLDDREDHLHAGTFTAELEPEGSLTVVLSTEPSPESTHEVQTHWAREVVLLDQWAQAVPRASGGAATAEKTPAWIRHLVLAADQFIIRRPLPDDPEARSVIAGYPWFCDWGRDTMIALPGLTLSTGQPSTARSILQTFAKFVDQGMLPNRFPDTGESPEYNSVDAALWYFEAVRQYYAATRDRKLLRALFPTLAEIVQAHQRGTRYNIHVDPEDALLYAGAPGVQLTWMDAKVGDSVVTPRIGKPVEVSALWYNALMSMAEFARVLGEPSTEYERLAPHVRTSFQRFWNPASGCCFDVLDGPDGDDPSVRPNQLLAVSLANSPLDPDRQRAVVDICAASLVTSHGLRTLAPADPRYQGHYGGNQRQRDGAYHQGTVWAWLLGPFVMAHLRVYRDPRRAASFLEPMAHHLRAGGVGSISEIFDGDPPFAPRGAIAQAWSVSEVLRAWVACQEP
jgi:predicted glycogen debranching enzyme